MCRHFCHNEIGVGTYSWKLFLMAFAPRSTELLFAAEDRATCSSSMKPFELRR